MSSSFCLVNSRYLLETCGAAVSKEDGLKDDNGRRSSRARVGTHVDFVRLDLVPRARAGSVFNRLSHHVATLHI